MKKIQLLILSSITLAFTACSTEAQEGQQVVQVTSHSVLFKSEYLSAVNRARSVGHTCGARGFFAPAPALKWNDKLYKAAYEHSNDMATTNTFSHAGSGETSDITGAKVGHLSNAGERILAQGYRWQRYAENIGAGTNRDTAQKAVDALMASDGHCANIMNPNFTELGMAVVRKSHTRYTYYWTQNFASR